MYIEKYRRESFCDMKTTKNGELLFLNKAGVPLTQYPRELIERQCPLKSPLVVHLELTKKCGLLCKHCYISAGNPRENELSNEEWENILDQLKELEVLSVYFTGGDPLLHKDCVEIVSYAHKIGLSCNLLTNGLEFEKSVKLDDIPKEVFIVLSYDGINGTSVLRNISGNRILKVIELLRERKKAFAIQSVIFRDNISEVMEIVLWCMENGIDLALNDIYPIGRMKENTDLLIRTDQIQQILKLESMMKIYDKQVLIPNLSYPVANPNIYGSIKDLVQSTKRPEPGLFVTYISSDGFLYADNYYAAEGWVSDYNLRTTKFSDAWSGAFCEERKMRIDEFEGCKDCTILKLGGFCDLQNMAMSKNLYGSLNQCGAYPELKQLKTERILI